MRAACLLLLPLLLLSACQGDEAETSPAGNAGGATPDAETEADLRTLQDYELSMDDVRQYYQAQRNIAAAVRDMTPAERAQMEAQMEAESEAGTANDGSLDDYAARVESNPVMRAAVREAGLSGREFSMVTLAMLQGAMASGFAQMQPNADPDSLARAMQANPANVRFMREHEAELTAMQEEVAAEMEAAGLMEE